MRLSLKAKIISGFMAIIIISAVIGVYGFYSINHISALSDEQKDLQTASNDISNVLVAHYTWRQNLTISVYSGAEFTGSFDPNTCALGQWRNSDSAIKYANDKVRALLQQLDGPHSIIHTEAELVMRQVANGENAAAQEEFLTIIMPNANTAINLLTQMTAEYGNMLDESTDAIHNAQNQSRIIIAGLVVFAVLLSVILAVLIIRSVLKPIRQLVDVADNVAKGNLNVNIDTSATDETGVLARGFAGVVGIVNKCISDIENLSREFNVNGDMDARLDASRFEGAYRELMENLNSLLATVVNDTLLVLGLLGELGDGNFSTTVPKMPGKKAVINDRADKFKAILTSLNSEINALSQNAMDGNMSNRANEKAFHGDWAVLINGLNGLMDAVATPFAEVSEVMGYVAQGNFEHKIDGDYKGDFLAMKEAVNTTVSNIASYIDEIAKVLTNMSQNDLNQGISRNYVGAFVNIKDAMNLIIETFNDVIGNITSAAGQVAAGAKAISDSSMTVATGATKQASAVEELNATVSIINESTLQNAGSAKSAETLSGASKNNASIGDTDMKGMLTAMQEIKDSSGKISNIIKVIEDIAFQTNLLALNAAVEAARAGEHGKGFAVVADEVRTLASRSQTAARETAELIEESITRVEEGTHIADKTAGALRTIVGDIDKIADIVTNIADLSQEQTEAVTQVMIGLNQITDVVQNNSSISEEAASASQELHSQAEVMRNMVSVFKLKPGAREED